MTELTLAYLDPGAGSILLQVAIGSLVGLSIFFRQGLMRISSIFRKG